MAVLEALPILREDGAHPDEIIRVETHEPPKQQIVVEPLHESALAANRVEVLEGATRRMRWGGGIDGQPSGKRMPRPIAC